MNFLMYYLSYLISTLPLYATTKSTARRRLVRRIRAQKEAGDGLTVHQQVASQSTQQAVETGQQSNLDDSTPQTTTKVGVALSEQQMTVNANPVDGNARSSLSRANAHLNEMDWDLNSMLSRYNLVGAFLWNLTNTVGTELTVVGTAPMDIPQDLLQNDIVSMPFMRFQWCNFDRIRVRFQLVASRFHQGRLGVYFVPSMMPKANSTDGQTRGPTRWTQLQHGFLDPSNGTVLDFEIPFRYHKGWIDLVFGDVLGQLHVQVMNTLQAASGASTSVEVKVFVSFEGTHFRVPRPGGDSFRALLAKSALENGYELVPKIRAKKESGMFAGLGKDLGNEIDGLVKSIVPHEITGAIAGIALDKPAMTEFPPPLVHKDAQYMSASRGVENLERMTLEPSAMYITDNQFGDSVDEMDMKYLLKKKVFLGTINWSATQVVGTILWQTVVSPSHLLSGITGSVETNQPFDPTIIGFLSNFFTYWRGGIDLQFVVVGTGFHEGRLDFCNHPATTTVPTDYATSMSQYVNSQTIRNTNNTVEIRVPFHSDTPWKRVWNGEQLSDTYSDNAVRSMDYVTGSFSLRVAVPLKNPNNVVSNVDINVFVCAADDFEFHTLSIIGGTLFPSSIVALRKKLAERDERKGKAQAMRRRYLAVKEAGDLNLDAKVDAGTVNLGIGDVYTNDLPVQHFGEDYKNLREMCKRYQHLGSKLLVPVPGNNDNSAVAYTFVGSDIGGFIGCLMNCYRLFRGPLNFKLELKVQASATTTPFLPISQIDFTGFVTTNVQPAINPINPLNSLGGALGYSSPEPSVVHPPLVRFSNKQIAEFSIPFQSIYHSLLIPQGNDNIAEYYANAFTNFELDVVMNNPYTGAQYNGATYLEVAFGDETRLGAFLGFPRMTKYISPFYPNPEPVT